MLRKPKGFSSDPAKFLDWSFKLKAYLGALCVRYQAMIAITEQATAPILNVGLSSEEAQLSTQLYYALVS